MHINDFRAIFVLFLTPKRGPNLEMIAILCAAASVAVPAPSYFSTAISSISTFTSIGNRAASIVDRAGGLSLKNEA